MDEMPDIDPANETDKKPAYRLGLALSGGGARGFAHAGALMAIEEAGLHPDVIAGVSAGAVAAVLYAAGIPPQEIPKLFNSLSFRDFASLRLGHGGLLSVDKFKDFILKAINKAGTYSDLEDLPIPVYLGVTDLDNGRAAEFHSGPIGECMIASCSIPIIFKPVNINGVNYVDGGVLRNHPAWIIRDKCRDLIGVNVSPLGTPGKIKTIADVALRTYDLMAKSNQAIDMSLCDVSVQTPEISNHKVFNLKDINAVVTSGYMHTRRALKDAGWWKTDHRQELSDTK